MYYGFKYRKEKMLKSLSMMVSVLLIEIDFFSR